jgi:hypothetical protein
LAVDQLFQGKGLGGALLVDALARALRSDIAADARVSDAKDAAAMAFYRHHGFSSFPEWDRTLFVPLATVRAAGRLTDQGKNGLTRSRLLGARRRLAAPASPSLRTRTTATPAPPPARRACCDDHLDAATLAKR